MAAPNHVGHHQPAAAGASSSASPKAGGGHDPSVSPDRDPTRLLAQMLAGTGLGMPTAAAPNQFDQLPPPAAAAAAAAISARASHCPAGVAPDGDGGDPTLALTKSLATTTLGTTAAAAADVSVSRLIRTIQRPLPTKAPDGFGPEYRARRWMRVPTDYLRAGQESRDRRRRRQLVRRCVGRLFLVHEDRASERGISAMMARLTTTTTTTESAASGAEGEATVSSAAAPSSEHTALANLLEKMALSKKH